MKTLLVLYLVFVIGSLLLWSGCGGHRSVPQAVPAASAPAALSP